MILPIVTFPDRRLRESTSEVTEITDDVRTLAQNMVETMYKRDGAGLAAPQVGSHLRMFVVNVRCHEGGAEAVTFINPRLTGSGEMESAQEGCLSFPGVPVMVKRHSRCTVEYTDLEGQQQTMEAEGFLARALQHEYDHLENVLLIDHAGNLKRDIIVRKMKKQLVRLRKAQQHGSM